MRTKKNSLLKTTITLGSSLLLLCGAGLGMGFGIHNLSTSIQKSSDFDSGRSFQLNLRLSKVNDLGSPILTDGKPTPVYADKQEELKQLKVTAEALTTLLQARKLTNIQVSFGYSTITNSLFPDNVENIAVLYASFENSITAFGLNDITEEVNTYINNQKIFQALTKTYNYELESVQKDYTYSSGFGNSVIESTQRNSVGRGEVNNRGGIYYNERTQVGSGLTLNLQDTTQTDGEVKPYKGEKFGTDRVVITAKEELNSWAFVNQKNAYDDLAEASSPETAALNQSIISHYAQNYNYGIDQQAFETVTDQEKFQTQNTWILWKDKQGLVNYFNGLIMTWYYNMYANIIPSVNSPTREDFNRIFDTSAFNYENHTVPEVRDQINLVVNALTDTEKSIISMLGTMSGGANPTSWKPPLVTEHDLIPILYAYYNSKTWNPNYVDLDAETTVPSYGYSTSVKNGWAWIESNNASALNAITGDYIQTIIDYRNYDTFLADEDAPEDEDTTDGLALFTTNQIVLPIQDGATPEEFSKTLNNANKFDIIMPQQNEFVLDYQNTITVEMKFFTDAIGINFNDNEDPATIKFKEDRLAFTNKYFNSANLFSTQNATKPLLVDSWVNYNSLYILLIILAAIIFIIGIFIAVRYRIPGFVAFMGSAFVFVVSAYLYNVFGFVFSFNTVIALIISTFLSLLSPIFLLRNVTKEVKENSTLSAAVIKSVKKYWKMSLDTHVIALLSSLSFLFFGIGGNINFGAMLVVSVFLSFILSGVIFFILMLFYTQYYQFANSKWFFSHKLYQRYTNFDHAQAATKVTWLTKLTDRYSIYSKTNYYTLLACAVIALVGCIVLGVVGPGNSLDFKQTNILTINHFESLGLSLNQVVDALKINVINAYVYADTLTVFTESTLELNPIITALNGLGSAELSNLTNNVLTTTLTTSVAMQIINNTMVCFGIAIAFVSVWTVLSLNIVSLIPMVFTQLFNLVFIFGFFGIVRLPMDLPILAVATFIFIISSILSASCLSSVKSSWNRRTSTSQHDLKLLVTNIVKKISVNYWVFLGCFAVFAVLAMIFASTSLVFVFLLMLLSLAFIGHFNQTLLMTAWYYCVILRDLFNNELQKTSKREVVRPDYDTVNEQIITGINN